MPSDYNDIRPEPTALLYRDQLISVVRDRRGQSERYGRPFRMKLPKMYDLWRGVYTGNYMPTKNNVHIPMIYSSIWSDTARKIATSFSSYPILTFRGFGPDDAAICRKQEALIDAQLRDARVIEKELVTFLSGDLYGTAVSMLNWDHKEQERTRTGWKARPISGEMVRQIMRERVTLFDGPNYRNIDLLDFYPCPNFRSIFDMPWVIVRYYLDIDEVEYLASEIGGRVFDAPEVARMRRESNMTGGRQDEMLMRRFEMRTGFSNMDRWSDKWSRPVEVIEMWGTIPRELAGPLGSTNVVISVANDNYLLRAYENPFHNQMKPFIVHQPTPDPHYFYAPGKAEVSEKLQVTINRIVNQLLDAGDLVIHPMFMYNRLRGVNTRNLVAGPGRIFGVDGPPSEALAPIPFDMRGMSVGMGQVEMLWRFLQMGTSVQEDTIMGFAGAGSSRQTAREFLGRREASGTRLMLESVLYEANYLEPLGNWMMSVNEQLLTVPRQIMILGDAATEDPVTGDPIPVSRETINGWDLTHGYTARALGSTMSISKQQRQSIDLTVFQTLATAQPMVAGAVNMVNFLRQMLRNLDYPNVNEYLKKVPDLQDILAKRGMQGGVESVPESSVGAMLGMAGAASGAQTNASPITMSQS